jgi:gliding motility-associated-like protein
MGISGEASIINFTVKSTEIMKKLVLLILVFFTLYSNESKATHLIGGEITWVCNPTNGTYRFMVRLYRECGLQPNGFYPAPLPANVPLTNNAGGIINCNLMSQKDVSPDCFDPSQEIKCGSTDPVGTGAIQIGVYQSAWTTLNGIPPVNGWTFAWGSCCRPGSVVNLVGNSFMLRATMYPYNNTNASACYDNSPDFLEDPKVVACSGADIVYNNLGFDSDLDSLYYVWGNAMNQNGGLMNYVTGYAFNNPIPDNTFNAANTGAQLDGTSGQINFTCLTNGSYATVLKVEEWRCGQKIGEIFRDIPLVVRPCLPNTGNCPQIANQAPTLAIEVDSILYPNGPWVSPVVNANNQIIYYETTLFAKEQINLNLTSYDLDLTPDCNPQIISFSASGGNLSDAVNYNDPTSCKYNAPCATITPMNGPFGTPGGGFSNAFSNNQKFQWQTDCPHLTYQQYACGNAKSVYEFYFRMEDDACPTPGFSYGTYKVNVLNYPPEAPDLTNSCVSLDEVTGELSFDWIAPVDTGINFDYFVVYHSTNINGPFTAIDTVNSYGVNNYVDGNQTTGGNYYYMRTRGGCELLSGPSDTISLIEMTLTPLPPTNSSVADLSWTPHNASATGVYFQIWRRVFLSGTWSLVDSTTSLSYMDSVDICSSDLEYQIRINGKCYSTTDHAIFSDQTNNEVLVMDSVTVNGSQAILSWQPSTSEDVIAYLVMYFDPGLGAYVPIDTLPLSTAMPYSWSGSVANTRAEQYVVVTLDSCVNQSSEVQATPLKSIHLDVYADPCAGTTSLRWNDYLTFTGGAEYDVLVDIKDDQGIQLATGALLSANGTNLTFTHNTLINGYEYCYYIRAKDSTGLKTSTSNVECINSIVVKQSRLLYLASTNVRSNGSIELYGFYDKEADVLSFSIERSEDPLGPYLTIGTIPKPTQGPHILKYSDYTALPETNRYYYRISATDVCGAQGKISNIATSLLLKVKENGNASNTVVWNKYYAYGGYVKGYELYRQVDNSGSWDLVASDLNANDTVYEDNVSSFAQGQGRFCYYVVAKEGDNPLFFVDEFGNEFTSRSNNGCVIHDARVFIPNAFNPASAEVENTVWGPQNVFAQANTYSLEIYNRWGNRVFSTSDMNLHWDGSINGDDAPMGVYNYYLKYTSLNGAPKEARGSFTLFRNVP